MDISQALAVALDHCEETGEVSIELLSRMAEILNRANSKIAYGWNESLETPLNPSANRLEYTRYQTNAGLVARVKQNYNGLWLGWYIGAGAMMNYSPASFESIIVAKRWCDEALKANGFILLEKNRMEYINLKLIKVKS